MSKKIRLKIGRNKFPINDIRIRLAVLVIIIILPFLGISIFQYLQQRQEAKAALVKDTTRLVEIANLNQNQIIETSRQFLISLTLFPVISDSKKTEDCNRFLADRLKGSKQFTNIAVADPTGIVYCSAVATNTPVNVSDRLFFTKAVAWKDFAVGEYVISKITNIPTIQLAYPIVENSRVKAVVYVGLDLDWINSVLLKSDIVKDVDFFMIDQNGTFLARSPDPDKLVGKVFDNVAIIKTILTKKKGTAELPGVDGIDKIFAFTPLTASGDAYIAVGYRKSFAYQGLDNQFRQQMIILLIVTIISVFVSWWIGHLLIVQKVSTIAQMDKLKDELLSVASHELRTPLTAIDGITSMILDGEYGEVGDNLKQPLGDITTSSQRLIHLVNDLLTVSRLQAGRLKFTVSEFNLSDATNQLVRLLKPLAEKKKLTMTTDIPSDTMVSADAEKVEQIITNIVGNALKFTDQGGISIKAQKSKDMVEISISDTGIGIPAESQDKLFGKFEQIGSAEKGRPAGTGLGLYISREITRKMGGNLWLAHSEVGKGSMFVFSLPFPGSDLAKEITKTLQNEAAEHPNQKSETIKSANG